MRIYPGTTVDYEFGTLGGLGHTGSLNDRQFSFLRSTGLTGALADMFGGYTGAPPVFSPLELFAGGELGAWYDPSDLTTLFQDSAGVTPVTAAGQPVGLMLDKSGRGNHAEQATAASRPTYGVVPVTGRRNLLTYTEQVDNAAWQNIISGTGSAAVVTADFAEAPDGTMTAERVRLPLNGGTTSGDISTRAQTLTYTAAAHTGSVWLRSNTGADQTVILLIENVQVAALTVTPVWQRFTHTRTTGAVSSNFGLRARGTFTGDNPDLLVWGWQMELGSTATDYQKVVTAFDVTEAGVASLGYLGFDGTDDFMVTPTITPGTDKAQVFAGVRKLSDSGLQSLIGHSATPGAANGTFEQYYNLTTAGHSLWLSRGTANSSANAGSGTSPTSIVTAGLMDIAGDAVSNRNNGVEIASSASNQGTGNYLAYPMYIGRRGGTSLPFNGNIYGLVARFGANLTADQIDATEAYMAEKTGVTL